MCCYAECHYAECHNAECHYAEGHYAEGHYAEFRNAECHYAELRNAECIGTYYQCTAPVMTYWLILFYFCSSLFTLVSNKLERLLL